MPHTPQSNQRCISDVSLNQVPSEHRHWWSWLEWTNSKSALLQVQASELFMAHPIHNNNCNDWSRVMTKYPRWSIVIQVLMLTWCLFKTGIVNTCTVTMAQLEHNPKLTLSQVQHQLQSLLPIDHPQLAIDQTPIPIFNVMIAMSVACQ